MSSAACVIESASKACMGDLANVAANYIVPRGRQADNLPRVCPLPLVTATCFNGRMSAKTQIDILVGEYLATHPFFEYSETGDRHPSVLAIGGQKSPWLHSVLGGPQAYWRAMLCAARVWFAHEGAENTREFRLFCNLFEIEGNVSGNGAPGYEALAHTYREWRRTKNPRFAPE